MTETQLLTIAASLVAVMFGLLTSVLAWVGGRLYAKVEEMNKTMHDIAAGLHEKFNGLDKRVTVVETMMRDGHDRQQNQDEMFSRHS